MALLDGNREPSSGELRWFGWILAAIFAGNAAFTARAGHLRSAWVLAGLAVLVGAVHVALPAARRLVYRAWMTLMRPIGHVVSHLVLLTAYYLVVTPVALVMRLFRDPLQRRFDPALPSYFTERAPAPPVARYFRQF